jgi:hypothetical protein
MEDKRVSRETFPVMSVPVTERKAVADGTKLKPEIESPMKGNPNLLKLQEERVIRVKPSVRNVA